MHRATTLLTITLVLSACSKWPPHAEPLGEYFGEHRESFEILEVRMQDSEFFTISRAVDAERIRVAVEVPGEDGVRYTNKLLESPEWRALLDPVPVESLSNNDGRVMFHVGVERDRDSTIFISIINDSTLLADRKQCAPEHKRVPCGVCAVPLSDGWFVNYSWSPQNIVPGGYDRIVDGELTEEQFAEEGDRLLNQCWADGAKAMGYEVE